MNIHTGFQFKNYAGLLQAVPEVSRLRPLWTTRIILLQPERENWEQDVFQKCKSVQIYVLSLWYLSSIVQMLN